MYVPEICGYSELEFFKPSAFGKNIWWNLKWSSVALFTLPGFAIAKDLGVEVENLVSASNPKSPTVWSDKASTDEFSPVASSSNVNGKNKKPFSTSEQITESGSACDHSEEGLTRSPSSPGSTFESPFRSAQFDVLDSSPHTKESHRYKYFVFVLWYTFNKV